MAFINEDGSIKNDTPGIGKTGDLDVIFIPGEKTGMFYMDGETPIREGDTIELTHDSESSEPRKFIRDVEWSPEQAGYIVRGRKMIGGKAEFLYDALMDVNLISYEKIPFKKIN